MEQYKLIIKQEISNNLSRILNLTHFNDPEAQVLSNIGF
jgi:hypothetical protein